MTVIETVETKEIQMGTGIIYLKPPNSTSAYGMIRNNQSSLGEVSLGVNGNDRLNVTTNGVGIGTGSTFAGTSIIFTVDSTTQGSMPCPRMTAAQKNAIATPAAGMMVYDTNANKLCVYTGAAWETITSA